MAGGWGRLARQPIAPLADHPQLPEPNSPVAAARLAPDNAPRPCPRPRGSLPRQVAVLDQSPVRSWAFQESYPRGFATV